MPLLADILAAFHPFGIPETAALLQDLPSAVAAWRTTGLLALIPLAVATIAIFAFRRGRRKKDQQAAFIVECERTGLTQEEQQVLQAIAALSGLKHHEAIFTMETAFSDGAAALTKSERMQAVNQAGRTYVKITIDSLREKLGFQTQADQNTITASRQIPAGSKVYIAHRARTQSCDGKITLNNASGFSVLPVAAITTDAGDCWLVRYCDGGSVWEFEAFIIKVEDGQFFFSHSDNVRFVNRRRFPRVSVRKTAMLAVFPFSRPPGADLQPEFVEATLTEIAGPGLRLETKLSAPSGERALVMVALEDDKMIQAVGKVRRATLSENGMYDVVMELQALSANEVAELARETNIAQKSQEDADVKAPDVAAVAP